MTQPNLGYLEESQYFSGKTAHKTKVGSHNDNIASNIHNPRRNPPKKYPPKAKMASSSHGKRGNHA